jgi:hypothetical protein
MAEMSWSSQNRLKYAPSSSFDFEVAVDVLLPRESYMGRT